MGLSYAAKAVSSALLASTALFLIPAVAYAAPATEAPAVPDVTAFAASPEGEERYIVQYVDHVNSEAESASLEQQGIEVKETLSHAIKASVVVATPGEIDNLKNSDVVDSVELDTPVSVFGATSLWGLDRVDQRSGRDGQYSTGDEGAGVHIYVIDTGVNTSHTDFSGRVPTGWSGIHDGRGYQDCGGHGTHVAGTAAGTTYGVAKKAQIIPVRVLQCDGSGWSSEVMAGIDWAISHHVSGQPAVMNLSVGGFTNASFDETVQSAVNDGMTVVAAAGNAGADACGASPARVPSAITVAATNIYDAQASWSNYGSCVDVQAPGTFIRSAWINSPTGYNTLDGTSMAAPHVSGAAAILLSRDPGLSPSQVHQTVITNATTGLITANKGATPNRLLFIPAPAPALPSCPDLRPGNAWAGVGLHCRLQGTAGSAASPSEELTTPNEDPAATAVEAPAEAPVGVPGQAPESAPASPPEVEAPIEEIPAPAHELAERATIPRPEPAHVPLSAEQVQDAFPRSIAGADTELQDAAVAPDVIAPGAVEDEEARLRATATGRSGNAAVSSSSVPADGSAAAITANGAAIEDATELKAVAGTDNIAWAVITALVLAALLIAFAFKSRRENLG